MNVAPAHWHFLGFRGRLYALVVLSVITLSLFAVLSIYNVHDGSRQLSEVYEHRVEPAVALHEMEEAIKVVQFRLAGYLLDQLPAVGNLNHLEEARGAITDNWLRFREATAANAFDSRERELIAQIERNLGNVDTVFAKLAKGYQNDDKHALTVILEDEWPFAIHAALLKPISRMVVLQQAAVGTTYDASVERGRQQVAFQISILAAVLLVLAAFAGRLVTSLTRRLDKAAEIANRVAASDWSGAIEDTAPDEVGQLLRTIDHMRHQVHSRELRLETVLNNTAEGIITFDHWGTIERFNQAAERLFGWDEREVAGTSVGLLITAEARERRKGYLEHFLRNEIHRLLGHEGEVTGRHKDGTLFPMSIKISNMTLEGKELYIALVADVSERKAMVERLKRMAEHDGLTGLYNRSYFQDEVTRVVERAKRTGETNCALLYIDLDNFKYINDTLGHAAGDRLLVEVSGMLKRRARKSDLIARFGGDEFCVLLYDTKVDLAGKVAESFRKTLAEYAFVAGTQRVDIGCSIGVAMIDDKMESPATVLSRADLACHLAKRRGRNLVHVFTESDLEKVNSMSLDMGWSARIKAAIEGGKFALACQPILDTRKRDVVAYEVLVRMLGDNNEIIMPSGFLPAAERFGLAAQIDRWVIVNAIETLARVRQGDPRTRFSVNLSAQTIATPEICDVIRARLAETGLDPAALTFEITETMAISDLKAASELLLELRRLGCKTALDDFGVGMSSFSYLRELPVDYVKIDGRFVRSLATNEVDQAMVKAMNDIAHAMGKQTVAECVEDEDTVLCLADLGVDFSQGYHLGRPCIAPPCVDVAGHSAAGAA